MGAKPTPRPEGWTIASAEALLESLTGVVSARIVAKPGGEIEEIHLLSTEEVSAKQTVRNVESALLAHFDLEVDHRKISVARMREPATPIHASAPQAAPAGTVSESANTQPATGTVSPPSRDFVPDPTPSAPESQEAPSLRAIQAPSAGGRFLFVGHQVETARSHIVRMRVALMFGDQRFDGEASGTDLPRARNETVANATLRSLEKALAAGRPEGERFALQLDGVKTVEAFDRRFVLVAVHALAGREVRALSGAASIEESSDRAVILATLQATDRWVRGRM